jgi:AcrR family transcriptional regulator
MVYITGSRVKKVDEESSDVQDGTVTTFRAENRRRLRDSLIAAARELTVARGWSAVRMADVARAVGVSRQTLYNEFDGKADLAHALATAEITSFLDAVRADLSAHGSDVRAAGEAAILRVLRSAGTNPFVKAVLGGGQAGDDDLLPFLTTRAEVVLAGAGQVLRDWAGEFLPGHDPARFAVAAECVVRLTVSHVVSPSAPAERTAAVLADVLVRLLQEPVTPR